MTEHDELIEQLKREIRYRADVAAIPYEKEDIKSGVVGLGYTLVALTQIDRRETRIEDGEEIVVGEKTPNIWIDIPNTHLTVPRMNEWLLDIKYPLPMVHVLFPTLAFLIAPDGTITSGGSTCREFLNQRVQASFKEDMERVIADMVYRPGECYAKDEL